MKGVMVVFGRLSSGSEAGRLRIRLSRSRQKGD
jgi:hypothetical protein